MGLEKFGCKFSFSVTAALVFVPHSHGKCVLWRWNRQYCRQCRGSVGPRWRTRSRQCPGSDFGGKLECADLGTSDWRGRASGCSPGCRSTYRGLRALQEPCSPSAQCSALEAVASRQGTEQSAVDLSGVTHFGLHPLASRAMFMDQGGDHGREFGGLMDPSLPQQHFERAVASVLGESTPTTTGAQTCTTTTQYFHHSG